MALSGPPLEPSERRVVVIAGAGASTALGSTGRPIPMMAGWCTLLCNSLDGEEKGIADAIGLTPQMTGWEFEQNLGSFLDVYSILPLLPRFLGLGESPVGQRHGDVNNWHDTLQRRSSAIIEALHRTLFDAFGHSAVDRVAADRAYGSLLKALTIGPHQVTFATTNYDPAIEIGLRSLGFETDLGVRSPDGLAHHRLRPGDLIGEKKSGSVPVLHLHGATGWYRSGVEVMVYGPDMPYVSALGAPAILLPDPKKTPERATAISTIWSAFDAALSEATHVLVIGHSLHDPYLVERLEAKFTVASKQSLAFLNTTSLLDDRDHPAQQLLKRGTAILGDFGVESAIQDCSSGIRRWVDQTVVHLKSK